LELSLFDIGIYLLFVFWYLLFLFPKSMESTFEPLSHTLQSIQYWLSRDEASRLIVAAPTMAAMKRRDLPDHVKVTPNKQRGPRVATRNTPFVEGGRVELAHWPEAGISEYTLPILACVVAGQADLRAADYFLHCRPGDIVLFPAGVPKDNGEKSHLTGEIEGRSCDVLWMSKPVPAMGLCCYICQSRGAQHLTHLPDQECLIPNLFLERMFEGFCEELQKRGPGKMAVEMLSLIISLLKRDTDEGAAHPFPYTRSETLAASGESQHPIEQACLYIDSHLESRLTIASVARQVYLSPTQFTREFRNHTGRSFHEYLTGQRLKKAVQFLQETNMMVQSICLYVGITPNQLRNLFQKEYGCSPVEFRNRRL
jgi:AraC-like DNA-binding protein